MAGCSGERAFKLQVVGVGLECVDAGFEVLHAVGIYCQQGQWPVLLVTTDLVQGWLVVIGCSAVWLNEQVPPVAVQAKHIGVDWRDKAYCVPSGLLSAMPTV